MATKETNAKGLANAIATLENLRDLNADYTILSVNEGRINK
jgi:hypothetical protein